MAQFTNRDEFTNGEYKENITRVENLLEAYNVLEANNIGNINVRKDVLRASVVFMHSSLEEIVRNLFLLRLPNGSVKNLNKIPFVGHVTTHRPKEILLGNLKEFSGKLVDNVILDSINTYVDTMSINGAAQLAECLEIADIQVCKLREYFTSLDTLMKRRHQIVHQMDRLNELDPLLGPLADIELETVLQWKSDLNGFFEDLLLLLESLECSAEDKQSMQS